MTQELLDYIPLLDDYMFKYIFGNQKNVRFTEYLLENYFKKEPGSLKNKILIQNSFTLDKTSYEEHGLEADVIVKLPNGEIINIEAYTTFITNSKVKSLMYLAHLFATQLPMGYDYSYAMPHLQLNFVKDKNLVSRNYLIISNDEDHAPFINDLFEIRVINVEVSDKIDYNSNEKLQRLFMLMNASNQEEAKEIIKGDEVLMDMYDEMEQFRQAEWRKKYFNRDRLVNSVHHEQLKKATMEARLEGRVEASNERNIEIAKNMLENNIDIDTISKCTGLPIEEIEKLNA